jgi:periplasmic divalent cation tolerance protein
MSGDIIIVVTTLPDRQQAAEMARMLVERRLAACAQISGPITSTYWWQGKVEEDEEWQVKAKTCRARFDELSRAIRAIRESHPYELPQIVAIQAAEILDEFAQWIKAECGC